MPHMILINTGSIVHFPVWGIRGRPERGQTQRSSRVVIICLQKKLGDAVSEEVGRKRAGRSSLSLRSPT